MAKTGRPSGAVIINMFLRGSWARSSAMCTPLERCRREACLPVADCETDADCLPGEYCEHCIGPDGTIVAYDWNFGDGVGTGSGATPSYTYGAAGTYTVSLTVTDDAGDTDTAGTTAAFATLVAYWRRLQNGRGQHVDVSVMEAAANLSDWALPNFSRNAQVEIEPNGEALYGIGPFQGHRDIRITNLETILLERGRT